MEYLYKVLGSFVSDVFGGVMKDISPGLVHIVSIIFALLCFWGLFKVDSKIIKALSIIILIILFCINF